jgi:thiol-disulfide isomerase/thioredoxin
MNVTLPLWLVVSQWTLLFALAALLFLVYRQIGYLLDLKNLGTEREGLPIGEEAPAFDYTPVNQHISVSTHFEPKGVWSLLLFTDPGCVSCQSALPILERLAPKVERPLRTLVVTSAEPAQIAASDAFMTTSIDIGRARDDVASRLYRTHVTPFAYLIDAEGKIRAKGIATDESAMRKIVYGVERTIIKVGATTS